MATDFRKAICRASSSLRFLYDLFGCSKYYRFIDVCSESGLLPSNCQDIVNRRFFEDDVPMTHCKTHPFPEPPPPPEYPEAPDYDGTLIGMTAYSLIRYPLDEIEWFFRELVKAEGNATELFPVATWDDCWRFQPFVVSKEEKELWKDAPWNPDPSYPFPVFDLLRFDGIIIDKWRQIFSLAQRMNLTLMIRVHDFCSRKDNFLERHWTFWSNVQSWRWGGTMSGGYLHWPIGTWNDDEGRTFIWRYYERYHEKLISELNASGVKYFLEDWNELYFHRGSQYSPDAPDDDTIVETKIHKWFFDDFVSKGAPRDRLISNPQRGGRESSEYRTQVERLKEIGYIIEHHGCESPEVMKKLFDLFGAERMNPNGDGMDKFAKGINDGRPNYTEPSVAQAREMGRFMRQKNIKNYVFKARTLRGKKSLKNADFSALGGLSEGLQS